MGSPLMRAVTGLLFFVVAIGFLLAMSFLAKEDGTGVHQQQAVFTLMITGILTIFLIILATGKFWFPHLWKKNSSHSRHKQHSEHHPVMKQKPRNNGR